MIAEHDDDPAAGARRFALRVAEVADDLERVRPAVGDVAELDEDRLAAGPVAGGVDQAGVAGDVEPGGIIAVKVADGDDPRGACGARCRPAAIRPPARSRNAMIQRDRNDGRRGHSRLCRPVCHGHRNRAIASAHRVSSPVLLEVASRIHDIGLSFGVCRRGPRKRRRNGQLARSANDRQGYDADRTVGVPRAARDAGLRSYMLKVYNYMASGVLLTGIVAMLFFNSGYAERRSCIGGGILPWVIILSPLAIVFAMSFGANRMSAGDAADAVLGALRA